MLYISVWKMCHWEEKEENHNEKQKKKTVKINDNFSLFFLIFPYFSFLFFPSTPISC